MNCQGQKTGCKTPATGATISGEWLCTGCRVEREGAMAGGLARRVNENPDDLWLAPHVVAAIGDARRALDLLEKEMDERVVSAERTHGGFTMLDLLNGDAPVLRTPFDDMSTNPNPQKA